MSSETQALPIDDVGLSAKFARISEMVRLQLANVTIEGETGDLADEQGSKGLTGVKETLKPWFDGKSPVNAFSSAHRARHANGRVIDTLVRHLVEHAAIDQELASIEHDARRRAMDELIDIPLGMVDFVNRLMASGVIVRDVRDMSKAQLASVVSAIKGVNEAKAWDAVPDDLPGSMWPDHVDRISEVESAGDD